MNLEEIPSFRPTEKEFEDFIPYLSQPKVATLGARYGMIKIIPPQNFKPPLSLDLEKFKFDIRYQRLNTLNLVNRSRLFFIKQLNNYKRATHDNNKKMPHFDNKPYLLVQSTSSNDDGKKKLYLYDLYISIIKYYNRDITWDKLLTTVRDHDKKILHLPTVRDIERDIRLWKNLSLYFNVSISDIKYIFGKNIKDYYNYVCRQYLNIISTNDLIADEYPSSLLSDNEESDVEMKEEDQEEGNAEECPLCHKYDVIENLITCYSCDKFFHVDCINKAADQTHIENITGFKKHPQMKSWICKNCILGNGYYGFRTSSKEYTLPQFKKITHSSTDIKYNDTLLNQLEKEFWENVNDIEKRTTVKYGADIHCQYPGTQSGFPTIGHPPNTLKGNQEEYKKYIYHPANLYNLPFSKGSLLQLFFHGISGMTIPWLYVGSKFSTFCWHMEDQYALSANYQHEGAPKVWYSIPSSDCMKFQNFLINRTPDLFIKQPDLMHQLTSLVSPEILIQNGITCYRAVQHPNEYIVTYPKCYHAGFNSGYNLNEAVNFTTEFWLPYGINAIDEYRISKKQCIFDMHELLIEIIHCTFRGDVGKVFSSALAKTAYEYLLKAYNDANEEIQDIVDIVHLLPVFFDRDKLVGDRSTGLRLPKYERNSFKDNLGAKYKESHIYCTHCKTICSFGFVIHQRNQTAVMKRKKELKIKDFKDWAHFTDFLYKQRPHWAYEILCFADYFAICNKASENEIIDHLQYDELYTLKWISYIEDMLDNMGDSLDRK